MNPSQNAAAPIQFQSINGDDNLAAVEFGAGRMSDVHMASRKAEEAAFRRYQAAAWLQKMLGCAMPAEPSEEQLRVSLRNGTLLCRLMNQIKPGTISKIIPSDGNFSSEAYQCFENLKNFLDAASELRAPTFGISDLEQSAGSMCKVVDCLLALKCYKEWQQTGALGSWKYAGSLKSPLRGNVLPRGHGKPTEYTYKNSRKRLLPPDNYVEAEQPLAHESRNLQGQKGRTCANVSSDSENCPLVPEPNAASLSHLTAKFREMMQLRSKPMEELPLQENHLAVNGVEGTSFASLMNSLTSSKQPHEIPQVVELMFKKIVEEFQTCLSSQKEQIEELKRSKSTEKNQMDDLKTSQLLASASVEIQNLKNAVCAAKGEASMFQKSWIAEVKSLETNMLELAVAAQGYHKVLADNRKLYNEVQDLKGTIRVYCRVRPSDDPANLGTVNFIGDDGEIMVENPGKAAKDSMKTFKFNKVFGPSSTQEAVYLDTQPLIRSVLDGYNVCIFAYGQTGSGKTYTMSGPNNLTEQTWGVNYRALNDLFALSCDRKDLFRYEISVQMIEIYNEHLRDLLAPDGGCKKLEIRNCSQQNGVNVPDATMMPVNSTADVLDLMKTGEKNRSVGSTAMNERSSRSHSVLTVHVRGTDLTSGGVLHGSLHLVDLAGSERIDKSEATGERLKEAQFINKSLAALGDVIYSLSAKSSHVPYRNSKLTQLLQDSLGGQAKTLMFVHMSPDTESYNETLSTLKFAERVATVELGAARTNRESGDVRDLKQQIAGLKETLCKKDAEIEKLKLVRPTGNDSCSSGERLKQVVCRQSYNEFKVENCERSNNRNASLRVSSAFEARDPPEWSSLSHSCAEEEVFESCVSSNSGKQDETCCPPLTRTSSPFRERILNSKNAQSVSSLRPKMTTRSVHLKPSIYSDQNSATDDDTISDSSDRRAKDQKLQLVRKTESFGRSPASIRKSQTGGTQFRTPLQVQKLKPSDPRFSQGDMLATTRRYSNVGLPPDCSSAKRTSVGAARRPAAEGAKPGLARHLFANPNGNATRPTKS